MNTPDTSTPDTNTTHGDTTARGDEQARERSAETREIVAPTPADVRAKGEDPEDDDEPHAPAADKRAP
ncbi:hypothetical protein ACIQWA_19510 [Kitasatospora sp. NPDC098652]|uniref:hypothetical protein n=1 Tax=Kitasatospora sp. NPDC098652 TaxID=3364095 RepID=UPI003806A624